MSRKPQHVLPATIYSENASHDDFIGDEKTSIPVLSYITYDEYRQNLELMCSQDKSLMKYMRLFCEGEANGATPEELLSESVSKQRADPNLYDA